MPRLEGIKGPLVVSIEPNTTLRRFGTVYSIWEDGDWWRSRNGARRAWTVPGAADIEIELTQGLNMEEWTDA